MEKHLLCPKRLRQLPPQFSWIDQRLVREQHIDRLSHGASALYLFLATVADKSGLSYYSERSLCRRLRMPAEQLDSARAELVGADLIAYQAPLYQLLSLDAVPATERGGLYSLKQIFQQMGAEL
jgi:hypothetical protein